MACHLLPTEQASFSPAQAHSYSHTINYGWGDPQLRTQGRDADRDIGSSVSLLLGWPAYSCHRCVLERLGMGRYSEVRPCCCVLEHVVPSLLYRNTVKSFLFLQQGTKVTTVCFTVPNCVTRGFHMLSRRTYSLNGGDSLLLLCGLTYVWLETGRSQAPNSEEKTHHDLAGHCILSNSCAQPMLAFFPDGVH